MFNDEFDRRDFVALTGGATAALLVATWPEMRAAAALAATTPQDAPYQFLSADQVRELDAITSTLIPTDETPGAREAHVVRFIDNAFATFWKARQPMLAPVLAEIATLAAKRPPNQKSFAALNDADRIATLEEYEKSSTGSFRQLRNLAMNGMFSHPDHGGNFNKVGWKMIGFDDRYSWTAPFGYYDK